MGGMGDVRDVPLGFADPVDDAQIAFRAALRALSRPGEVVECKALVPTRRCRRSGASGPARRGPAPRPRTPLRPASPPWARIEPARWLQFHTGAPTVARPDEAVFAVVAQDLVVPDLTRLNAGTDESPERSATLVFELPSFDGGGGTEWSGPGLREPKVMHLAGVSHAFWEQWQHNHAGFPSGVDVFFVCGQQLVGLPRTTSVQSREGS
jgi:alpha-D-ribose 1-methylphosphonate 5-triphosphate synthase subunit PhnH